MNNTNRGLNRAIVLIVGLILLGLGGAAIAIASWPTAADAWTSNGQLAEGWLESSVQGTLIGATSLSWVVLGILAVMVLIVVLLIAALFRLGGGRTRAVLRSSGRENTRGRITVKESFVSDALNNSFDTRDDILFAHVSASDVRKQPVLHVSVSPRQNTSPRAVVEDVDRLVTNLSSLTGQDLPTYISVHSGLRTRLAHDQRRLG